jgi:hypothetical protein
VIGGAPLTSIVSSMKIAAIILCTLLIAGAVALVFLPTRHLTKTPPQTVKLINGTNVLSFPVVQGRYLLRIGRADMEPASFGFRVHGHIETPAGPVAMDETYAPRPEVLSNQVSGGYISRFLNITNFTGRIGVAIVASFPESEILTCTFQGIK